MRDLIGQKLGDYEILSEIGRGAMGIVYKARQFSLDRLVALKILSPLFAADESYVERFKREGMIMASIIHTNIVSVYEAGSHLNLDTGERLHYFAMEYVEDETVQSRLACEDRIAPDDAIAIAIHVAQGLEYAWKKARVIHRDIKPSNIFLSKDGHAKVGDLGLARCAGDAQASASVSATGSFVGSACYMSLEQARGGSDMDFRSDIYSLGCTLYRMICGKHLYESAFASVMVKHLTEPPPSIRMVMPDCPVAIAKVIEKMLAKHPSGRHQSYQELIENLRHAHEEIGGVSPEKGAAQKATKAPEPAPARRKRTSSVVAGIAAVVAVAGVLLWAPWRETSKSDAGRAPTRNEPAPLPLLAAGAPSASQSCVTSTGMELVWIPPGEFMLGSTAEEREWATGPQGKNPPESLYESGEPMRTVIKNGFWLGRTKITVGQWKKFVDATGYLTEAEKKGEATAPDPKTGKWGIVKGACWRDPNFGFKMENDHPACCITWNDAAAFCQWLTETERKANKLPNEMTYRLPTEAEWECACRAGTKTKFWWGDSEEGGRGRFNGPGKADGFEFVSPVDHFGAQGRNSFGLADMLGNVMEWCLDSFDPVHAHAEQFQQDALWEHVLRGGCFYLTPALTRCAARHRKAAFTALPFIGFRVACGMKPGLDDRPFPPPKSSTIASTKSTPTRNEPAPPPVTVPLPLLATGAPNASQSYVTSTGMELVPIPPGEFMMGSTPDERKWARGAGCPNDVNKWEGENSRRTRIANGFWLGRTEVTVGDWKRFVTATGYLSDAEKKGGETWRNSKYDPEIKDNHPVCCVNWNDAMAFCQWLTKTEKKANRLPVGMVCRLPSEAEWEYACRAGSQSKFWWGDKPEGGQGRVNWSWKRKEPACLTPVDYYCERGRNGFGLADMLGNVWEWCLDEFDPEGAHEGCYKGNPDDRVKRGGSFRQFVGFERCAVRTSSVPTYSRNDFGFRVCCGAQPAVDTGKLVAKLETNKPEQPRETAQDDADFSGRWQIKYSDNSTRTYEIDVKGNVLFIEENRRGQLFRGANGLVLDFNDGKLERLSFAGGAVSIERFDPKASFPAKPPVLLGSGTRGGAVPANTPTAVAAKPQPPSTAFSPVATLRPDEAAWSRAVNLMPLIDPARDTVKGIWKLQESKLILESSRFARILIPYEPPEEYDFRIILRRVAGKNSAIQSFSQAGRAAMWLMGSQNNTTLGFQMVGGIGVPRNRTCIRSKNCLETGRDHTSVLKVRKNGVKAYLDAKLISEWATDFSDASLDRLWSLPDKRLLALGSHESSFEFHKIDLLEITGKGRAVRGSSKVATEAQPKQPVGPNSVPPAASPISSVKLVEVKPIIKKRNISSGVGNVAAYTESRSMTITIHNGSAQSVAGVIVRWGVVRANLSRGKNTTYGTEEIFDLKPLETKTFETPVVVASGKHKNNSLDEGEKNLGHGVQILVGNRIVAEDFTPPSIKPYFETLKPPEKP